MKGLSRPSRQRFIVIVCLLLSGPFLTAVGAPPARAGGQAAGASVLSPTSLHGSLRSGAPSSAAVSASHQPITRKLIDLLRRNPALRDTLAQSLRNTGRFQKPYLRSYYAFLDRMITTVPDDTGWLPMNLDL